MGWNLEPLFSLTPGSIEWEAERARIIREYINSIPEDRRKIASAMQVKIDAARETMSQDQLLRWMRNELVELSENLSDQFLFIAHRVQQLKSTLDKKNELPPEV
jgi:hypothetical protein